MSGAMLKYVTAWNMPKTCHFLNLFVILCKKFRLIPDPHTRSISEFLFFFSNIYLFLAALGLCCCPCAFSSCGEWELLFVVVRRLFIVMVSLVAEHRF